MTRHEELAREIEEQIHIFDQKAILKQLGRIYKRKKPERFSTAGNILAEKRSLRRCLKHAFKKINRMKPIPIAEAAPEAWNHKPYNIMTTGLRFRFPPDSPIIINPQA